MNVSVYRNLSAIRFIRCVAPIPGTSINAGGAALTLNEALIKCESELVERKFEICELLPKGIRPIGIAAHFNAKAATEKALQESIESLCVKQVAAEGTFNCLFFISVLGFSIGIARTEKGFFCLAHGKLGNNRVGTTSAASSFFSTILKVWEEYRSIHFFRPHGEDLRKFSKVNILFPENSLQNLKFKFKPTYKYQPQISALEAHDVIRSGRHIVYFLQSKKDKTE
jgi:hypothetical protein